VFSFTSLYRSSSPNALIVFSILINLGVQLFISRFLGNVLKQFSEGPNVGGLIKKDFPVHPHRRGELRQQRSKRTANGGESLFRALMLETPRKQRVSGLSFCSARRARQANVRYFVGFPSQVLLNLITAAESSGGGSPAGERRQEITPVALKGSFAYSCYSVR
jgi:hypothetical protein